MANHNPIINEITKAPQNHGERALVYLSKVPGLTSCNFNSFPFEKEGIVSFYQDPFNSIDCKNDGLQLGKAKPID